MPEIWAEIQLCAFMMKMNGKAHSWMKYLLLHAQIHNQADGFATSTWTQEWTH